MFIHHRLFWATIVAFAHEFELSILKSWNSLIQLSWVREKEQTKASSSLSLQCWPQYYDSSDYDFRYYQAQQGEERLQRGLNNNHCLLVGAMSSTIRIPHCEKSFRFVQKLCLFFVCLIWGSDNKGLSCILAWRLSRWRKVATWLE